jgi:hypothetical protein
MNKTDIDGVLQLPIEPGTLVTILGWIDSQERSWCGEVIRVKHCQYPYVIVDVFSNISKEPFCYTLDVRKVELIEISNEFAHARYPNIFPAITEKTV